MYQGSCQKAVNAVGPLSAADGGIDAVVAYISALPYQKRGRGNPRSRRPVRYKDCVCAFDIETTKLPDQDTSIMYIWQFCAMRELNDYVVIYGRTWEDFVLLMQRINNEVLSEDDARLMVYIHNASYEFQFLRGVFDFTADDVFVIDPRKILKFNVGKCEYRCSYMQTNLNLRQFARKMKSPHQKTELDYTGERYPDTPLTDGELEYCVNDVICLCESIIIEMQNDGDNLYTIPLTSTGYVRRDAKRAMKRAGGHSIISRIAPDFGLYTLLREAFRGGNTHANRYYSGLLIDSKDYGLIHSADRSSSYPAEQCTELYPMSHFEVSNIHEPDEVLEYHFVRNRAAVFRASFTGLQLRDSNWGCPYLSTSKCRDIVGAHYDNGRILDAESLTTTLTDIDLIIILSEYQYDSCYIFDCRTARYGKLPAELLEVTREYFRLKTALKGDPAQEYLYMKSKNKLNSIYGMMAQDPVKDTILFEDYDYHSEGIAPADLLEKYNKKAFLAYQWGCWVTAWARYRLEQGIQIASAPGCAFLYTDTDSVKYVGDADFTAHNAERVKAAKAAGAYATDSKGNTHYMGVFEQESDMVKFKTLGAKKYCYCDLNANLHVTIAGVGKIKGAAELGSIERFNTGFVFKDAAGLEAVYNDLTPADRKRMTYRGHEVEITSNVCLKPSEYTLGITNDYYDLLNGIDRATIDL